jgi:hypothetical protein
LLEDGWQDHGSGLAHTLVSHSLPSFYAAETQGGITLKVVHGAILPDQPADGYGSAGDRVRHGNSDAGLGHALLCANVMGLIRPIVMMPHLPVHDK